MQVSVIDPVQQTILFSVVLGIVLLLTFFKKQNYTPLSLTQELKGFAILVIIFAHIGYSLSTDSQFLFPLSVLAGVGVNLFLFLSGYGLTFSELHKGNGIIGFYIKRLLRLFIPFWIVLLVLFLLDYFLLGGSYSKEYIVKAILGIFTRADIPTDINSPLWYFSFILFYYLFFPLVFSKRYTWATALVLYAAVWLVVKMDLPFFADVMRFYQVHMLAFPLGILAAAYLQKPKSILFEIQKIYSRFERYLYHILIIGLSILIGYLAIHSNVGALPHIEEATSLFTMFVIIALFIVKKREFKVFSLFGFFSYEIYLFHWPLLYRYDFLYTHMPPWIATILYLGVFIGIAYVLKKLSDLILKIRITR